MTESSCDPFQSSDSQRAEAPLKHAQRVMFHQPLTLKHGGTLASVAVTYETYGTLNAAGDNAILICHALTGDSHVARHDADDAPGWWDVVVGPGKPIDTDRYFVVCPNILGGCRGTTGPNSINPATGKPYGADFPVIHVQDMVDVQEWLGSHLGIDRWLSVVGGSLGGQQAMTWAVRYPDRLKGCLVLASSPRLTSQALAFDVVGRNAILRDPNFHHGQYYDQSTGPDVGLALARMLGHITYLSPEAMSAKFDLTRSQPRDVATDFEKRFSVGSYLAYQGHRFVERFDANSYVTITLAMDLFDLGDNLESLQQVLSKSTCRWLLASFTSDWLFPPSQSRQIVQALLAAGRSVSYANIQSDCGHDAFLLPDNLPSYGPMIAHFLADLAGPHKSVESVGQSKREETGEGIGGGGAGGAGGGATSIFHGNRLDYRHILDLIEPGQSVLDVGCGNGDLLELLGRRGHRTIAGAEVDQDSVLACMARGLDVVHVSADDPLGIYRNRQFDVVVLSQALQSIQDTQGIIGQILRVGQKAIVSFPNFAYQPMRQMLYESGRSPKSAGYPYHWYDSPNCRFPSILDFEDFCRDKHLTVHRRVYLDTQTHQPVTSDPNRNADVAIFLISPPPPKIVPTPA